MEKVVEIIKQITETGSTKEKESILKKHKDNDLLKRVLEYTYNPFKKYKVTDKILGQEIQSELTDKYDSIFELLDVLSTSNINNKLRSDVINFLNEVEDADLKELYKMMLLKDLRMKCNSSTINKVWKNLIPKFSVMLAESYYDHMDKVKGKQFTLTMKEDGNRIVIIKEHGDVKCYTRQGQEYNGLDEIVDVVKGFSYDNFVIDGELMILNHKEIPSDQRYKMTSKIVRKDGKKTGVKVVAFDMVSSEAFKNGKSEVGYSTRRYTLEKLLKEMDSPLLEPVELLYSGNDVTMIEKILDEVTGRGEEGIMINLNDAPYECKRTRTLLKAKKFKIADLRVTNIFEGDGEFSNMLGAIEVEFEHKGELHRCNCGTGFSQTERIEFYNNPELLLNKIVEVKYFEISSNDDGGFGLRFPVFIRIRDDKDEISMY